jgi:Zn-finger protein
MDYIYSNGISYCPIYIPDNYKGDMLIGSGNGQKTCPNCSILQPVRKIKCKCDFIFIKKQNKCISPYKIKKMKSSISKARKSNFDNDIKPIPPPPKMKQEDMFLPKKHKYKLYYNGVIVSNAVLYGPFLDFENTFLEDKWDQTHNLELSPLNTKMYGKFWDINEFFDNGWLC